MVFLPLKKSLKYSERILYIGASNDERRSTLSILGNNENWNNK